jgi:hypothetical protein
MSDDKSTTRGGGRPAREDRSTIAGAALQVRVTPAERETLERLVTLRNEELAEEGARFTASSFLRWLIRREARLKGIAIGAALPLAPEAAGEHEPEERRAPAPAVTTAPKRTRPAVPPSKALPEMTVDEVRALASQTSATQNELAHSCGMARATIGNFLHGKTNLDPGALAKLAAFCRKRGPR